MKKSNEIKRGSTVTYTKEIMFKGPMQVTAKIVVITPTGNVLLDNGDEMRLIGGQLYAK